MKLNEETKDAIKAEDNSFKESMYANKTLEERKVLDQFFTPSELTIQMIEKFDCESLEGKTILDPTCGSGNLLAACLIAGADADKVFGNDYDDTMVKICRERLKNLCEKLGKEGFEYYQIHRGNALQKRCITEFSYWYQTHYKEEYIDDLEYAQGDKSWEEENRLADMRANLKNTAEEELW